MWRSALHRLAQRADFGGAEVLVPLAPGTFGGLWGGGMALKRRYLKDVCCVCLINGHRNPVPKKAYNAAASACSSSKWRLSTSMMQVDGWTRECVPNEQLTRWPDAENTAAVCCYC